MLIALLLIKYTTCAQVALKELIQGPTQNSDSLTWTGTISSYRSGTTTGTYQCQTSNYQYHGLYQLSNTDKVQTTFSFTRHYRLFFRIDILYTGVYTGNNQLQLTLNGILLGSSTLNSQQNPTDFQVPSAYCQLNQVFDVTTGLISYPQAQKSYYHDMMNQDEAFILEISGSIGTQSYFGLANLIILIFRCSEMCLTCSGEVVTSGTTTNYNCLTCSVGQPYTLKKNNYLYQNICGCPAGQIFISNGICSPVGDCTFYVDTVLSMCLVYDFFCLTPDNYCTQCQTMYYNYNGACYTDCPTNTIPNLNTFTCTDYNSIMSNGSSTIFMGFQDLILPLNNAFQYSGTGTDSKLTGSNHMVYGDKFLLGGFGVWGSGSFYQQFVIPNVHYQIRVYVWLYFIDYFAGASVQVSADDNQVYEYKPIGDESDQNIMYDLNKDKLFKAQFNFPHLNPNLLLKFTYNPPPNRLSASAFTRSLAISDLFIYSDNCGNVNCTQCSSNKCIGCKQNSSLILDQCEYCPLSSIYFRDSQCQCKQGYYDTGLKKECTPCQANCNQCTASGCITCQQGYYLIAGLCGKCDFPCSSCSQTASNCTTCIGLRINPPKCTCVGKIILRLGYFNNCTEVCASQCESCDISASNCLTCAGDRIKAPDCTCPSGGISVLGTPYCTSCSSTQPFAQFSDDLTQIIITFKWPMNQLINCQSLFDRQTLQILGDDPQCFMNDNIITTNLGGGAKIIFNQPLQFNPDYLYFSNCSNQSLTVVSPLVQSPKIINKPILYFNQKLFTVSPCTDVLIEILSAAYNSNRNIKLLNWTIISTTNQFYTENQINLWNQNLDKFQFIFSSINLQSQTEIKLQLWYQNILYAQNFENFTLYILPQVFRVQLFYPELMYTYQSITVSAIGQILACQLITQEIDMIVQVLNGSQIVSLYQGKIEQGTHFQVTFPQFLFLPNIKYTINATATYINQTTSSITSIQIQNPPTQVSVIGGNRIIGQGQYLILQADIFDPSLYNINDLNISNYEIQWGCLNKLTNFKCLSKDDKPIVFNQSQINNISTNQFQPYTILQITLQIYNIVLKQTSQDVIYIKIIEYTTPQVQIRTNKYHINQQYSPDNTVSLNIYFPNGESPDIDRMSSYAYANDGSYSPKKYEFNSLITQIPISSILNSQLFQLQLYVVVKHPDYNLPSQTSVNIQLNQPPQGCKISVRHSQNQYILQISQCSDADLSLMYSFIYYWTQEDLDFDHSRGIISKGFKLCNFIYNFQLNTYLPNTKTTIILGLIRDQFNGISNITFSFNQSEKNNFILSNLLSVNNSDILARNILSVINNASNIILNQSTLNQLQTIVNQLNQSEQNIMQLQAILLNYSVTNHTMINSLLQNNIDSLTNLSNNQSNLFNQQFINQYSPNYQLQMNNVVASCFTTANYLQTIYSKMRQGSQQGRLLSDDQQQLQQINRDQLIQGVNMITNIITNTAQVNKPGVQINTTDFSLQGSQYTSAGINNQFKAEITNISNQSLSYTQVNYTVNPYQNESEFIDTTSAPFIIPQIRNTNSNISLQPVSPMSFEFPFIGKLKIQCASQIGGSWSVDVCSVIQGADGIKCLCQSLSPLSIVGAIEFILNTFSNLYTQSTINSISNFPYYSSVFTYIAGLETILFFVSLYYAYLYDIKDAKAQQLIFETLNIDAILKENLAIIAEKPELKLESSKVPKEISMIEDEQERQDNQNYNSSRRSAQNSSPNRIVTDQQMSQQINVQTNLIPRENQITKVQECSFRQPIGDQEINKSSSQVKVDDIQLDGPIQDGQQQSPVDEQVSEKFETNQTEPINKDSLIYKVENNQISKWESIKLFMSQTHLMLEIIHRYDKDDPRIFRCTILYIQIMIQITIFIVFGKIIGINVFIVLSLIQTLFGLIFQIIIRQFMTSEIMTLRWIGLTFAVLLTGICLYMTLAAMSLYTNLSQLNITALQYLASFVVDHFITNFIILMIIYLLVIYYHKNAITKKILKMVLKPPIFILCYGLGRKNFEKQTNRAILDQVDI